MITNDNENIIYFDNDDEFYEFCVVPKLVPVQYVNGDGQIAYYTDFNLSDAYHDAVKAGKKFMIKNEDSSIFKHKCVSYRTLSKPIENLCQYFADF